MIHPIAKKHLQNIEAEDMTKAEKQMASGRNPSEVLQGIAFEDMTTAEKKIWREIEIKARS